MYAYNTMILLIIAIKYCGRVLFIMVEGYSRIKCGTLTFVLCLVFVIVCALRSQYYNSLRFIEAAYLLMLLILRWCVSLLVEITIKSSVNGVEIIFVSPNKYPCFASVFKYSIKGLNTIRNIVEDIGTPWNTPRLYIKYLLL